MEVSAGMARYRLEVLRVDDEAGLALVRVVGKESKPSPTKWWFLNDLRPVLLEEQLPITAKEVIEVITLKSENVTEDPNDNVAVSLHASNEFDRVECLHKKIVGDGYPKLSRWARRQSTDDADDLDDSGTAATGVRGGSGESITEHGFTMSGAAHQVVDTRLAYHALELQDQEIVFDKRQAIERSVEGDTLFCCPVPCKHRQLAADFDQGETLLLSPTHEEASIYTESSNSGSSILRPAIRSAPDEGKLLSGELTQMSSGTSPLDDANARREGVNATCAVEHGLVMPEEGDGASGESEAGKVTIPTMPGGRSSGAKAPEDAKASCNLSSIVEMPTHMWEDSNSGNSSSDSSSIVEGAIIVSSDGETSSDESLRAMLPSRPPRSLSPPPPPRDALEKGKKRVCATRVLRPPSKLPEPPSSSSSSSTSSCFDANEPVYHLNTDGIDGVEIRASGVLGGCEGGKARGERGAGLGVFCARAVRSGQVVFEEEALLHVARSRVSPDTWRTIERITEEVNRRVRIKKIESLAGAISRSEWIRELEGFGSSPPWMGSGVREMDLLQAVAFDSANSVVQRRVLDLHAPPEGAFPGARRSAWNAALDALRRVGTLGSTAPSEFGRHHQHGDQNDQGQAARATLGDDLDLDQDKHDKWRSSLLRVLRICEANIFGEYDHQEVEHGARSLFDFACRINHSCLPNCSYLVKAGKVTVRAMTDLQPGTELSVSYLPWRDVLSPTPNRRQALRTIKYFDCHCCRCSTKRDFTRGIRCPRCYKGTVYPPCEQRETHSGASSSTLDGRRAAVGPGVGDAASIKAGASACTACGRVSTGTWLASAVRVEEKLGEEVHACQEKFAKLSRDFQSVASEERCLYEMGLRECSATMARLYAQALFLLTDHHSMYVVHDHLVGFLAMEGRVEEAAYHSHEKLVILLSILGRPTMPMIEEYERLAFSLSIAAGIHRSQVLVPRGYWLPPSAGRCGTYVGLVQIPPPVHRSFTHKGNGQGSTRGIRGVGGGEAAPEESNCPVCGKRHGRPWDLVTNTIGTTYNDDIEGVEEGVKHRLRFEGSPEIQARDSGSDRLVYLDGARATFRSAVRLCSTVHGHDSTHTVQARFRFQDIERRANQQPRPPLPIRPTQR